MYRQVKQFVALIIVSIFCSSIISCSQRNWNSSKEHILPGGGPLAKIRANHTFTFVVIGDTRTGISIFEKQINEINLIDPDLVIDVGDMINGYAKKPQKIEAMWDEFDKIVSQFTVPFIMVPGNHDIWSPLSRKIYQRRYGKTYFSFDYKGVHFIVLDSEIGGIRLSDAQIKWLKSDLESHRKARATFVFLHRPLWQDMHVGKGAGENWLKKVHPILVKNGVDAVFAGHVHKYIKYSPIDGVSYYITGGGGAGIANNPSQGDFHHYCLITVRDDKWKMAVIKPGAIYPDTIVTSSANMQFSASASVIDITVSRKPVLSELTIINSSAKKSASVSIIPDVESNSHFKIKLSEQTVSLKPGKTRKIRFNVVLDDIQKAYPAPKLLLKVKGLSKNTFNINVNLPVRILQIPDCFQAKGKVKIDGKLEEPLWSQATLLSDFRTPNSERKAKFPTETRIAYDATNLYLAFRCYEPKLSGLVTDVIQRDGTVWDDDSVEIFIDTNFDRKTYYQFVINANAVIYDGKGMNGKWNGQCYAQTGREDDAWTLEVAIPWKTIGMNSAPKPGTKLGFEVTRNRIQKPSELTQWAPTFGSNHAPERFGTIIIR